jgi:hypothetical protein
MVSFKIVVKFVDSLGQTVWKCKFTDGFKPSGKVNFQTIWSKTICKFYRRFVPNHFQKNSKFALRMLVGHYSLSLHVSEVLDIFTPPPFVKYASPFSFSHFLPCFFSSSFSFFSFLFIRANEIGRSERLRERPIHGRERNKELVVAGRHNQQRAHYRRNP